MAYPDTHSEALNKFDSYLRNQLIKPFTWTITKTLERMSEMYDMRSYVPAPGDDVLTALYDEPRGVLPAGVCRQMEFDLLPEDWQTRVKGKMINWLNKEEAQWTRVLRQVETEVQLYERQKKESEVKRKK